ncbi:hypothetical protein H0H87_003230 [Tephrocybe sp. NHM501043]|nr:hypothetical protein H0H87_003230 [Tephrocybe sp. NHM501043]
MLLKFTTADMFNTTLIDVSTRERAYEIVTVLDATMAEPVKQLTEVVEPLPTNASSNEHRHTSIKDASGNVLVSISWKGRRPNITILDDEVGQLTDLFGSSTVKFMPKYLVVPTRFDTEYIWTATPDSLTLFDYDSEKVKGTFHQNVIRVSAPFTTKLKCAIPSTLSGSSPSSPASNSPACLSQSPLPTLSMTSLTSSHSSKSPMSDSCHSFPSSSHTTSPKSSFIATHLPGVGGNYLEFCQHPLAHDVEIVVSFLMMEILRRGRFLLTPYTFEKPRLWQLKEARDLVMRRLRRNTV